MYTAIYHHRRPRLHPATTTTTTAGTQDKKEDEGTGVDRMNATSGEDRQPRRNGGPDYYRRDGNEIDTTIIPQMCDK